jgi:hypothetical protein
MFQIHGTLCEILGDYCGVSNVAFLHEMACQVYVSDGILCYFKSSQPCCFTEAQKS